MRLTCLVDNTVALGSALWGEHGLSFLIETEQGNVLWDTGRTGTVLQRNLRELKLEGTALAALALSHAHHDHTGGIETVLEAHPGLPVYAHETIFHERFGERQG
ncbi:MAG: MBL fold metallo-hydrolase, partial [Chloroflexi bacterium]|nr:MBL fold metallo-hydrolase [Chloroflexota bacterium]